jgi:hypothetical protein
MPASRFPRGAIATYGAGGSGIAIYPPHASTASKPLTTLAGAWQTDACESLAFDQTGFVYALCRQAVPAEPPGSVVVFAPGATGDAAPTRIITGPSTGVDGRAFTDLAVDAQGFVYVLWEGQGCSGTVTVFAPGADGEVPPLRTITGPDTGLDCPSALSVDSQGRIYVGSAEGSPVLVYDSGADGNMAPIRRFGGHPYLRDVQALAVDANGRAFVGVSDDTGGVAVYGPDAAEGDPPDRVILGPSANIGAQGIAIDDEGRILVSDRGGPDRPGEIGFFSPDASGNDAPETVLDRVAGMGIAIAP